MEQRLPGLLSIIPQNLKGETWGTRSLQQACSDMECPREEAEHGLTFFRLV